MVGGVHYISRSIPTVYVGHIVSFPPSKLLGLGLQSLLGGT